MSFAQSDPENARCLEAADDITLNVADFKIRQMKPLLNEVGDAIANPTRETQRHASLRTTRGRIPGRRCVKAGDEFERIVALQHIHSQRMKLERATEQMTRAAKVTHTMRPES